MNKLISLLLMLVMTNAILAQKAANDWTKKFDSKVKWYKITDAGILVVCTKDALYGVNPADGKEIWKDEDIENIKEENCELIEGTPYIALIKSKMFKNSHKIVDVVTGKILANTSETDIMVVSKRLYMMKSNAVIFFGLNKMGKPTLVKINLMDGTMAWQQNKIFEKNKETIVSGAEEVKDGIFIATTKNIYKLNPQTGEVIYSIDMQSDAFEIDPKQSATETAINNSADFFQHGNASVIYFWNQDILTAFNTADGKEVWKRVELPSPISNIIYDTHGMLVATAEKTENDKKKAASSGGGLFNKIAKAGASGKNRAALLCLDEKTGEQKWDSDIKLKGDVLAYKLVGTKLILATATDKGSNFINIVNLDDGKSVSKKPLGIDGEIRDLQIVPQGLYYRAADQINIMDMETGKNIWKKGGLKVENSVGDRRNEKEGYVFADDKIQKVDFEKGEVTVWIDDIKFNGKEDPTSLQVRENGVLLTSAQNAALFGFDGTKTWHVYEPAPGRTTGGKLLSGLGGLASSMVAVASTANAASMSYAKGYYGSTDPTLDNNIKNANANAASFAGAAGSSFAAISRRFKATKEANNYISILTPIGNSNNAKDAGIKLINKNTGKEIRSIILGDKKDPDYKLDELGKMVYYKSDGDELQGFSF